MSGAPVAVLVDGYNLLHAIPRFAPRGADPAPARNALETWLAATARQRGVNEVVLVWDGPAGPRARAPRPLEVLHTERGTTADERILTLCRERYADRAGKTWVVSSDHGVQRPARQLGFVVLGAMTFWRRWEGGAGTVPTGTRSRRSKAGGATDTPRQAGDAADEADPGAVARPTVRRAEVDELLDAFVRKDRGRSDPEAP